MPLLRVQARNQIFSNLQALHASTHVLIYQIPKHFIAQSRIHPALETYVDVVRHPHAPDVADQGQREDAPR